jgi:hypothetical protein
MASSKQDSQGKQKQEPEQEDPEQWKNREEAEIRPDEPREEWHRTPSQPPLRDSLPRRLGIQGRLGVPLAISSPVYG